MALTYGKLVRPFFRLSVDDFPTMVARRSGWNTDLDQIWPLFEPVARHLVDGLSMALDDDRFPVLVTRLEACDEAFRGIAQEGAGMGLMRTLEKAVPGF